MEPRRYVSRFGRIMLTPLPEPMPPHRRTLQYCGSRMSAPLKVRPKIRPLPERNPQARSAASLIQEAVPNAFPDPFQRYRYAQMAMNAAIISRETTWSPVLGCMEFTPFVFCASVAQRP